MTTAGAVAIELRRLADALDKEPDTEIKAPYVSFFNGSNKSTFVNSVRLMPRPIRKETSGSENYPDLMMSHENSAIRISSRVDQSSVCELVEPAKPAVYRCVPILSLEEEESLVSE